MWPARARRRRVFIPAGRAVPKKRNLASRSNRPPHPEEDAKRPSRRVGPVSVLPTHARFTARIRDATLRVAPQGEVIRFRRKTLEGLVTLKPAVLPRA